MMEKTIISQNDAFVQCKRRFYTGKPCKYGHTTERYVSSGNCVGCHNRRKLKSSRKVIESVYRTMGFVTASFVVHPDDMELVTIMLRDLRDVRVAALPVQPGPTYKPPEAAPVHPDVPTDWDKV